MIRPIACVLAILCSSLSPQAVTAQEKTATKANFTLPTGGAKIVLFRPDVTVGAQSMGGLFEPNADWTDQARAAIEAALMDAKTRLGGEIIVMGDVGSNEAKLVADYRSLFRAIAASALEYQMFVGNRLPTKKNSNDLTYTLGPGIAPLAASTGADYGLFLYTEDQYGSTGRKILQILALGVAGVAVQSGIHTGYAGLVDLRTGDLVWINADGAMGGDVRQTDGATKRVAQLIEGFPVAPVAAPAGPAPK